MKIVHSSKLNDVKKLYSSEPIVQIYAIIPISEHIDHNNIDNDLIERLIESVANIEANQNIKLYNSKTENEISKWNEIKCNYTKLDRGFKPKEIRKDAIDISYTPTFNKASAAPTTNTSATTAAPSKPATKVAPVNSSKSVTSFFGKSDSSKTVEVAAPKLQNLGTSSLAASFFDGPSTTAASTKVAVSEAKNSKTQSPAKLTKNKSPAKSSKSKSKSKNVDSDEDMDDDIVFTTSKSTTKPAPSKKSTSIYYYYFYLHFKL